MQTKQLPDGTTIDVIGLGLWDVGGGREANYSRDETDLAAIHSAIEIGYRHFDTAEMYASGHSEELLGRALQDYDRSDFFVTTKVSGQNIGYDNLLAVCNGYRPIISISILFTGRTIPFQSARACGP